MNVAVQQTALAPRYPTPSVTSLLSNAFVFLHMSRLVEAEVEAEVEVEEEVVVREDVEMC